MNFEIVETRCEHGEIDAHYVRVLEGYCSGGSRQLRDYPHAQEVSWCLEHEIGDPWNGNACEEGSWNGGMSCRMARGWFITEDGSMPDLKGQYPDTGTVPVVKDSHPSNHKG